MRLTLLLCDQLTGFCSLKTSLTFTNADNFRAKTRVLPSMSRRIPTAPKPDIWFAFPIDSDERKRRETHCNRFRFQDLLALEKGLHLCTNPLKPLEHYVGDMKNVELICYPWFLIEIKKKKHGRVEFCYCQAANCCSASLSMLEGLTRHLGKNQSAELIPPVVSLTVVGLEVRLWLAYTTDLHLKDSKDDTRYSEHVYSPT